MNAEESKFKVLGKEGFVFHLEAHMDGEIMEILYFILRSDVDMRSVSAKSGCLKKTVRV